jgi:hypothetical protein
VAVAQAPAQREPAVPAGLPLAVVRLGPGLPAPVPHEPELPARAPQVPVLPVVEPEAPVLPVVEPEVPVHPRSRQSF